MSHLQQLQILVREIAQTEVMPRFLNVKSQRKADGSTLSEADLAAQNQFVQKLPQIIDAPVLGEEMSHEAQVNLWYSASHLGLWVLDPIDGTTNFVHGLPHFAVSVAFIQNGKAQLGVVYDPVADECFSAQRGLGAHLNGAALPLRQPSTRLREAVAGVEIKRLKSGKLTNSIHTFAPFGSSRCLGSSTLDWCYLAAARYDVYLHGGQNLWDYAAGALIFEEAGGLLSTLEGDDFWSGRHVFIAAHADLFPKWLKWIRDNQV